MRAHPRRRTVVGAERYHSVMRALDLPLFVRSAQLRPTSDYRTEIPALRNVREIVFRTPVTFFIGENGSGKSTLIESIAIAAGFNAEGGSKNFRFETVRREEEDRMVGLTRGPRRESDGYFLRAESFFNVATEVDRLGVTRGYGGKSLHQQSHGESFLSLVLERFSGDGLYILDEPEAALSPSRELSLLARMHDLVSGRGSQFVIATHSPIVMAYPGATIYLLDADGMREVAYEDTEHYQVTRDFLTQRERMLKVLFS
jgi:predicted ATPase